MAEAKMSSSLVRRNHSFIKPQEKVKHNFRPSYTPASALNLKRNDQSFGKRRSESRTKNVDSMPYEEKKDKRIQNNTPVPQNRRTISYKKHNSMKNSFILNSAIPAVNLTVKNPTNQRRKSSLIDSNKSWAEDEMEFSYKKANVRTGIYRDYLLGS